MASASMIAVPIGKQREANGLMLPRERALPASGIR